MREKRVRLSFFLFHLCGYEYYGLSYSYFGIYFNAQNAYIKKRHSTTLLYKIPSSWSHDFFSVCPLLLTYVKIFFDIMCDVTPAGSHFTFLDL